MTHENFPNWEKTITDEIIKFEKNNQLFTELKPVATRPSMYTVSLLNDDFTPMDFVVHLLERIFHKSHEDALRLMLKVHTQGEAVCGIYTREVAETIVGEVMDTARAYHYPLKCIMCKDHEYVIKKSGS